MSSKLAGIGGANIINRRRFAMVVAVVLMASAWGGGARAQIAAEMKAADVFVAEGVPVDVTAANVTEARERGLVQGRVNGFRRILERIVSRDDISRVPALNANQIIDMVRDFSIANERSSAVRYIADLTVRFDPASVRSHLRSAGIPFTETVSKPLVLVPVLRDAAGGTYLWNDPNPWRAAWSQLPLDRGLVPLFIPPGEATEPAPLTSAQALAKDAQALAAIAARYDSGGAAVVIMTLGGDSAQIAISQNRRGAAPEELTFSYTAAAGQSRDEMFTAAAQVALQGIEESWRKRNRVSFGNIAQLTVLVPVADLKEWLVVKNRLAEVPLVDRMDIQAMTKDRVQLTLYYAGAQSQLSVAMAQYDLALSQKDGVWVIAYARGGQTAASSPVRPAAAEPPPSN